jgi:xylulokinase
MNVEIKQLRDPIYANARGASWIAAAGLGEIKFDDISELVQFKQIYQPRSQNRKLYDEKFGTFLQIYRQMKSVYHKLNQ